MEETSYYKTYEMKQKANCKDGAMHNKLSN